MKNQASLYRKNVALFKVQLWVLVILHKLLLIWAQLIILKY